ncbi:MAG: tetratricopeptide repeat protein [Acidianus sp.]|jgi:tetratricopeptide (TPR) repeat protein|nr:tetratricopeptide repeat protein [Acidianus sp.]
MKNPDEKIEGYFRRLYEMYNDDPRVIYEYANVLYFLGREREAIPLYRRALKNGLEGYRKDMCYIQLASSLRIVGELDESYKILEEIYQRTKDPASLLFLTLTLIDLGMKEKAICLLVNYILGEDKGFLSDYSRALTQYYQELCQGKIN